MKRLLLSTAALLVLVGAAQANVVLDTKLSGTGDNVVFDSVGANSALGHLNGQHLDVVRFDDLGLSSTFTGAANGNDIKIANTNDLEIQVFDPTNSFVVGTLEQVFSLNGTGTVGLKVFARDANNTLETFDFNLGALDIHKPSDFTLTASNGEVMIGMILLDVGGTISSFEHYRIDTVDNVAAVPEASTWAMMLLGFAGVGLLGMRKRGFRFA